MGSPRAMTCLSDGKCQAWSRSGATPMARQIAMSQKRESYLSRFSSFLSSQGLNVYNTDSAIIICTVLPAHGTGIRVAKATRDSEDYP
jgi:hypothetical protein